ncbi:hypothetical protein L7F22_058801 [Adiantum nelumboides]|nr:hypothetical protein [Adiantum nelumboides]
MLLQEVLEELSSSPFAYSLTDEAELGAAEDHVVELIKSPIETHDPPTPVKTKLFGDEEAEIKEVHSTAVPLPTTAAGTPRKSTTQVFSGTLSSHKKGTLQKKSSGPLTRDTSSANLQCLYRAAVVAKDIQVSNHGRLSAPALLANCLLSMISLTDDDDGNGIHKIAHHRTSSAPHSFQDHYNHLQKSAPLAEHRRSSSAAHPKTSSSATAHRHDHPVLHAGKDKQSHHVQSSSFDSHVVHEVLHHRPSSAHHSTVHKPRASMDHVHEIMHHRLSSAGAPHHGSEANRPSISDKSPVFGIIGGQDGAVANQAQWLEKRPYSGNDAAVRENQKRVQAISCCLLGCGRNHSSKSMGSTLELLENHSTSLGNSFNGGQDHQRWGLWGTCDLRRLMKRVLLCKGITERDVAENGMRRSTLTTAQSRADLRPRVNGTFDHVMDADEVKRGDQNGGAMCQMPHTVALHDMPVAATFVFASSSSTSSSKSSHSVKIMHENAAHPWLAAHSPLPGLALLPVPPSARHSTDHVPHGFDVPDHPAAHVVSQDDLQLALPNKRLVNCHRS